MVIQIRGREWTVQLLTSGRFTKLYGKKTGAITLRNEKKMVFRSDEFDHTSVLHELIHCYIDESYLESCVSLNLVDFEEIICETLSNFWNDITRQCNEILQLTSVTKKDIV